MDEQEAQYRKRAQDFPNSPLTQFSLGRYLLSQGRYPEAVAPLEQATLLQADYAAGLDALGDAYKGAGQPDRAKETWESAKRVALAQSHPSLADEIDQKLADL